MFIHPSLASNLVAGTWTSSSWLGAQNWIYFWRIWSCTWISCCKVEPWHSNHNQEFVSAGDEGRVRLKDQVSVKFGVIIVLRIRRVEHWRLRWIAIREVFEWKEEDVLSKRQTNVGEGHDLLRIAQESW